MEKQLFCENETVVFVEKRDCFSYPDEKHAFAPSTKYPEYPWDDIADEENIVYDMVRSALRGYGLDRENYGTSKWNPLGQIVKKGDTVLVKPNWVMHYNENSSGGLDCLFTHTSITRAMVDYVAIALEGTGKIVLADSPMPDCNFAVFQNKAGINTLKESFGKRGLQVEIADLRGDVVKTFSKSRITKTNEEDGIEINIGRDSWFANGIAENGGYRYSFLDATKMNEYYHNQESHRYVINRHAIEADVIINLPKIKTHRKAGYTAALKNYIGICYKKDAIPHFVKGNKRQGGDEFNGPSVIFRTESAIRDHENAFENKQNRMMGLFLKALRTPFWAYRHIFASKYQGVGNWIGNDTIWRAVLDINRIIYYADKNGKLCQTVQRRFFSLGDMIIAGQKNGPLAPQPRKCGYVVCSEDPVAFDMTAVKLMGFNKARIPIFRGLEKETSYPLPLAKEERVRLLSSNEHLNAKQLSEYEYSGAPFIPADGWDGILK